jgi:hypothetical protein
VESFLVSFDRSEVCTRAERVRLLLKFRFRFEFFDFRISVYVVVSLHCVWSSAIRLSEASFVAPIWDIVAPYLELATIRSRVSYKTSFDSKQPKMEPKLVSTLSETRRLFRFVVSIQYRNSVFRCFD